MRWAGGRSRRHVSNWTAALPACAGSLATRRPLPSPLPSLPPLSPRFPRCPTPVPQPLLAPLSLRTVEVFGLCPARLTITFLSLADVRPVPRPVVPYGKRSFGSRSAVLTAKHPPSIRSKAGVCHDNHRGAPPPPPQLCTYGSRPVYVMTMPGEHPQLCIRALAPAHLIMALPESTFRLCSGQSVQRRTSQTLPCRYAYSVSICLCITPVPRYTGPIV